MSSLRIVHVVDSADWSDGARQLRIVRERSPADRFEQHVVARSQGPEWLAAFGVARTVRRLAPNVVHLWDSWAMCRVGPLLGRLGRRAVCSVREPSCHASAVDRRLATAVLKRAAASVFSDPTVRESYSPPLRRDEGSPTFRCEILAEAATRDATLDLAANRRTVRAELGMSPEAKLLGVDSHLAADRNVRDFVWLGALLGVLHDDLRLLVIGDGPCREDLRRFASLLRCQNRVCFLGRRRDAARLTAGLDLYVDCAARGGPAHGICEAQAAGVPVLCVDTPVRRRQIAVDRSGLLVREHDRAALVRRAHKVLCDDALRAEMAAAALAWSRSFPTPEYVAARYAEIYEATARA